MFARLVSLVRKFLESPAPVVPVRTKDIGAGGIRLAPTEFKFPQQSNPGTDSSGVSGIQTVVLKGDPNEAGVYTIMLRVPAHTQIAAHSHRDDRVATVISGTWRIGYGDKFDAETADETVVVQITGFGPSSTEYVDKAQDPRLRK